MRSVFNSEELALLDASFKSLPSDIEEAKRRLPIRGLQRDHRGGTPARRLRERDDPPYRYGPQGTLLLGMVKELMAVATGEIKPTDRDAANNQRIEGACELMTSLFHHLMIKCTNDVKLICQKSLSRLKRGIPDEDHQMVLSNDFHYRRTTNSTRHRQLEHLPSSTEPRVGVAQALQRLSLMATISSQKDISQSTRRQLAKPRYLHGTHWEILSI